MAYKKHFCSFADTRLKKSLNRIGRQAIDMDCYHSIILASEADLDNDFALEFKDKLNKNTRGFGYWCWKPQIILQALNRIDEGDVLQYVDSGCHLNKSGKKRLVEYFELAANSESGIVLFKAKEQGDCAPQEQYHNNLEYRFTKGDTFKHFNVQNIKAVTHTNQFAGAVLFIRKDPKNLEFVKDWIRVFKEDFSLIDDSVSKFPNFEGFIDHRHDQSIVSMLAKLRGVEQISEGEIYTEEGWDSLKDYPVWAKRDKDFGMWNRMKKMIYPIYKVIFK